MRSQRAMSMPLIACSTAPPRPCQKVLCRSRSVTRAGSSARSPISIGQSSLTAAAVSALLVYVLPMPVRPSSVSTSTMVWRSSSGFSSSAQPPSTVPPASPVMRTSTIFMEAPQLVSPQRSRHLAHAALADTILVIDQHDPRLVISSGGILHLGERRHDDDVARLRQVGRGAVDADNAGACLADHCIGQQPRAARHVPDVDLLKR